MSNGPHRCVVAIDGGGTHTRLLLSTAAGVDLVRVDSAATNYRKSNLATVRQELRAGFERLMKASNEVRVSEIDAVCAGFAGVDTPKDVELLLSAVSEALEVPAERVLVCNDGEIALEAALNGEPGVLVISGTGSIVWAADDRGNHIRIGGWDYLLGDEGSGYDIGLRALRLVAAVHDKRANSPIMPELIFRALHVNGFDQLVESAYAERLHPHQIASLSAAVEEAAAREDEAARRILQDAARELVGLVRAAVDQAQLKGSFKLVPMGGVLKARGHFTREFERMLKAEVPGAESVLVEIAPVVGAKHMALRHRRSLAMFQGR